MKIIHNDKYIDKLEEGKNMLYKALKVVPAPSSRFNLNTSQKYWWYWFGYQFIETKDFIKLDQIHLQEAAFWLDTRNKIIGIINKLNAEDSIGTLPGQIQTFKSGAKNISVYVTLLKDADKAINRISERFGLSIKDRSKLISPPEVDPAQTNLFKEFMDQKTM